MVARRGFWKNHRLPNKSAFDAAFNRGRCSRDNLFVVYGIESSSPLARLGMAVSKKVSAKAHIRNRIKRLIRDSFCQHQTNISGLDVVVVARRAAASSKSQLLKESLEKHWKGVCQ